MANRPFLGIHHGKRSTTVVLCDTRPGAERKRTHPILASNALDYTVHTYEAGTCFECRQTNINNTEDQRRRCTSTMIQRRPSRHDLV